MAAADTTASLSQVLDTAWYTVVGRPGALRGDVSQTKRKCLTVGSPFVLQFNPEHEKNKRKSSMKNEKAAIVRDFNPAFFHFLKIHPREIVAKVALDASDTRVAALAQPGAAPDGELAPGLAGAATTGSGAPLHRLVVNSSPLYRSHCLLLLEAEATHPQVLTPAAMRYACRLLALPGTPPDACVGYNSLGAWASVNHLHMHVFRAGLDMFCSGACPVHTADLAEVGSVAGAHGGPSVGVWRTLDYPLQAWAFTSGSGNPQAPLGAAVTSPQPEWTANLSSPPTGVAQPAPPAWAPTTPPASLEDALCPLGPPAPAPLSEETEAAATAVSAAAGALVSWLLEHDVPHNVLVVGGGSTVYVIPRAVQQNLNDSQLNIAIAESVGLPIATTSAMFEGVTQAYLDDLYAHFCLSPATAKAVEGVLAGLVGGGIAPLLPIPSVGDGIAAVHAAVAASAGAGALPEGTAVDGKRLLLEGVVGEAAVELFE